MNTTNEKRTKDWSGNGKSIYVTLGASNHVEEERQEDDFYATDPTAIDDLLRYETFNKNIWECACGQGHLAERLKEITLYNIENKLEEIIKQAKSAGITLEEGLEIFKSIYEEV